MHKTDLFIVNGADLEYTKKSVRFHGECTQSTVYSPRQTQIPCASQKADNSPHRCMCAPTPPPP